jgi:hypothetical protein
MRKSRRTWSKRSPASSKARLQPAGKPASDHIPRPVEEILAELAREVPQAEWDKLPADLTDNLDHYLYGTPKR